MEETSLVSWLPWKREGSAHPALSLVRRLISRFIWRQLPGSGLTFSVALMKRACAGEHGGDGDLFCIQGGFEAATRSSQSTSECKPTAVGLLLERVVQTETGIKHFAAWTRW